MNNDTKNNDEKINLRNQLPAVVVVAPVALSRQEPSLSHQE